MDNIYGYPNSYIPVSPGTIYPNTSTYQRSWQQYQSPQPTTATPQYSQTQPINSYMIWVQGESGAKAYVLPNNTTLPLWDSESQTIYIKSVDSSGKPSMTILDYVDRNAPEKNNDEEKVEYATKEQVTSLSEQFEYLSKQIATLSKFATKDQFDCLNGQLDNLSGQIDDIENRLLVFSKPQNTNGNNKRGGGK